VPDERFSYMTKFIYMTNGVYRLNPGADMVKCRTWRGHSGQAARDDSRPPGGSLPAGPGRSNAGLAEGRPGDGPVPQGLRACLIGFPCPVKRSGDDPRAFASASLIGPTRVHNPTCNGHRLGKAAVARPRVAGMREGSEEVAGRCLDTAHVAEGVQRVACEDNRCTARNACPCAAVSLPGSPSWSANWRPVSSGASR
jgi:hypothetical protein